MKIVIIGGTGFIGSKCVTMLRQLGHQVIAASPANHINTITKEGLAEALENAAVVVDVSNSPAFDDPSVRQFFEMSGQHLMTEEASAGVKHHLVLSIVGIDRTQQIGYMRGKIVQEELVRNSGIPYTIVRSTQFFEFLSGIADQSAQGNEIFLSNAQFQPIAADEVASLLAGFALSVPINTIVDIAGPERSSIAEMIARYLQHMHDTRKIIYSGKAAYYGQPISDNALVPIGAVKIGAITFEQWLGSQPGKG
jgi:uncharacterized protein YbjT (DUF2867 family)